MDIFDEVGHNAALDKFIEIEFKNEKIYFEGKECGKAFDEYLSSFLVSFSKGKSDLPIVNGIMLNKGPVEKTGLK